MIAVTLKIRRGAGQFGSYHCFVMMVVPMALGKFWQPAPRTTWEWQITGTVNTSYNAQMSDVDLQDAVPSPRTYPVSAA